MNGPQEYIKIRHMEVHKVIVDGIGRAGLHIWDSLPTDNPRSAPPQYRFVLPYDYAIELGTYLAFESEKLKAQDFSPPDQP